MEAIHTIRVASERTGLSPHTIRAWEKRYGALDPERTSGNHRLYSDSDLRRLRALKLAVDSGQSIGIIARLELEKLESLGQAPQSAASEPISVLAECERAIDRLDAVALEQALQRAAIRGGAEQALESVVIPLVKLIDQRYMSGTFQIAHEHLLSATLRAFLDRLRHSLAIPSTAPRIVSTTPSGQMHEIGALMVCVVSALAGWNAIYLGPNLPAREIAEAAKRTEARSIALSLVYPTDDRHLSVELHKLREYVGSSVRIICGGRGALHFMNALNSIDATVLTDVMDLKRVLAGA